MSSFEKSYINRSDWINISQSFKFTNCINEHDLVSSDEFLIVAMNILFSKCSIHVPLKRPNKAIKYKFQKEHSVSMRKRTILRMPQIISQHCRTNEQQPFERDKNHEEHVAVSKIKVDYKYFYRYSKRYSICKQEVGPLLNPNKQTH